MYHHVLAISYTHVCVIMFLLCHIPRYVHIIMFLLCHIPRHVLSYPCFVIRPGMYHNAPALSYVPALSFMFPGIVSFCPCSLLSTVCTVYCTVYSTVQYTVVHKVGHIYYDLLTAELWAQQFPLVSILQMSQA